MKLTSKQERFCQEIAKGLNQSDAYREAYDTENMKDEVIHNEACVLMKNHYITIRIKELTEEALEHVKYDIEAHYRELEQIRQLALVPNGENGRIELHPAIKATELKGKLKGLYIERVEQTNKEIPANEQDLTKELAKIAEARGITLEELMQIEGI